MKKKKKTGLFVKVAAAIFILYALVTLTVLQAQINYRRQMSYQLVGQLSEQTLVGAKLREATGSELDQDAIVRLAREKLGYVFPGEIVLVDVSK